jgi:hypothetical protein
MEWISLNLERTIVLIASTSDRAGPFIGEYSPCLYIPAPKPKTENFCHLFSPRNITRSLTICPFERGFETTDGGTTDGWKETALCQKGSIDSGGWPRRIVRVGLQSNLDRPVESAPENPP